MTSAQIAGAWRGWMLELLGTPRELARGVPIGGNYSGERPLSLEMERERPSQLGRGG